MFWGMGGGQSLDIMSSSHPKRLRRYFSFAKHLALCGAELCDKAPEGDEGF